MSPKSLSLVLALTLAVAGCTPQPAPQPTSSDGTLPSPLSSEVASHFRQVCDQVLLKDEALRPLLSTGYSRGENNDPYDEHCFMSARITTPINGTLRVSLDADIVTPDGERSRNGLRRYFASNPVTREGCPEGAECWIEELSCSTKEQRSTNAFSKAHGLTRRYAVTAAVAIIPDNKTQLCMADEWSKVKARKLMNDGLTHLLSK